MRYTTEAAVATRRQALIAGALGILGAAFLPVTKSYAASSSSNAGLRKGPLMSPTTLDGAILAQLAAEQKVAPFPQPADIIARVRNLIPQNAFNARGTPQQMANAARLGVQCYLGSGSVGVKRNLA